MLAKLAKKIELLSSSPGATFGKKDVCSGVMAIVRRSLIKVLRSCTFLKSIMALVIISKLSQLFFTNFSIYLMQAVYVE